MRVMGPQINGNRVILMTLRVKMERKLSQNACGTLWGGDLSPFCFSLVKFYVDQTMLSDYL